MEKAQSHIKEAREILAGRLVDPLKVYRLSMQLKKDREFGYARRLLSRLRNSQVASQELPSDLDRVTTPLRLAQQEALCTYKDSELPARARLDRALSILAKADDLNSTTDQESLGMAGAIWKRKWEVEGQLQHLERALAFYRRGYEQGVEKDFGYTAINTAYVLDLIAHYEESAFRQASADSPSAEARRAEARQIRQNITYTLPRLYGREGMDWLESQWWFPVTIAEAHFGLGEYAEAGEWLARATAIPDVPKWEYESTAQQLINLARIQGHELSPDSGETPKAWAVLREFLGEDFAGIRAAVIGKAGLALSGGGLRAALYHVGVLAKLAELDLLRHVEVLSCVSGGSIIGAYYYLEVRHLLQTKRDEEITREDYIEIVRGIERDFLAGVQRNIRTRVAASFTAHLKLAFHPYYSRSDRMGDVLEREIFSRVRDGQGDGPRWLDELKVHPKGEAGDFSPGRDNGRRRAKVPVLILNAATLNTGHGWQFTTSWMGESQTGIDPELDGTRRLQRLYYSDAPQRYRKFRLGRAVAASAATAGIFDPVVLDNLYPSMAVRLSDGSIYDSQGVAALLEHECRLILSSSGNGPMTTLDDPGSGLLGVTQRAHDVLVSRLDGAVYEDLVARRRSALLRGLMFMHLRKGLDSEPLSWTGAGGADDMEDEAAAKGRALTPYGVRKDVQERLAGIRTELDSFSDTEAYALMLSGYLMTGHEYEGLAGELRRDIESLRENQAQRVPWSFLALEEPMKTTGGSEILKLLKVARSRSLKAFKVSRGLQYSTTVLAFLFFPFVFLLQYQFREARLLSSGLTVADVVSGLAMIVFSVVLWVWVERTVGMRKPLNQLVSAFVMLLGGCLVARIHLLVFDKIYLRKGRIDTSGLAISRRASAPAQVVQNILARSPDPKRRVLDRSYIIEQVAKLFGAAGFEVEKFPRGPGVNPLRFDLDLYARGDGQHYFVEVKTAEEPGHALGRDEALGLVTASNLWAIQAGPTGSGTKALLVLVGVSPADDLVTFADGAGLSVLTLKPEDVDRINELSGAEQLRDESLRLLKLAGGEGAVGGSAAAAPRAGGAG